MVKGLPLFYFLGYVVVVTPPSLVQKFLWVFLCVRKCAKSGINGAKIVSVVIMFVGENVNLVGFREMIALLGNVLQLLDRCECGVLQLEKRRL